VKNNFKYLLFDLDGTLTEPYEGITKSFQYALNAYGIKAEQSELLPVIGPPLIDSFCNMYGFDEKTGWEAVNKYRERYEKTGWRENSLICGVPEMLDELKRSGRRIALATSKPYVFALKILKEYNIEKYFDAAVGAELNGEKGTKPEIIRKALKELDCKNPAIAAMVGDRKYDISGAKQCGTAAVGVRVGYAEEGELEAAGADYIADTIYDLKEFLLAH